MPWLVLRGAETEAVLWHGPVLELDESHVRRLGPDILADPPEIDAMVSNFRGADQRAPIGEALLDQRLVAGIGNMWRAEALWRAKLSPWRKLGDISDDDVRAVLTESSQLMRRSLASAPCTARSADPARAAAPRSSRADRATRTASPIGAPTARKDPATPTD